MEKEASIPLESGHFPISDGLVSVAPGIPQGHRSSWSWLGTQAERGSTTPSVLHLGYARRPQPRLLPRDPPPPCLLLPRRA
jgi:hypothetical protein